MKITIFDILDTKLLYLLNIIRTFNIIYKYILLILLFNFILLKYYITLAE